jgi:hypothetical protein
MEYTAISAEGEIIVYFVEDPRIGKEFVDTYIDRMYGDKLDIKFQRIEEHGELYIFSVPIGQEDDYCEQIKPDKIITGTERLDSRLQKRFRLYDSIVDRARCLDDQLQSGAIDVSGLRKLLDEFENS